MDFVGNFNLKNTLNIYKDMLFAVNEAYKDFRVNDNKRAKEILLEYAFKVAEHREDFDEDIRNVFENIVPMLDNTNERLLFFKLKSSNYKTIEDKFTDLMNNLNDKIDELSSAL